MGPQPPPNPIGRHRRSAQCTRERPHFGLGAAPGGARDQAADPWVRAIGPAIPWSAPSIRQGHGRDRGTCQVRHLRLPWGAARKGPLAGFSSCRVSQPPAIDGCFCLLADARGRRAQRAKHRAVGLYARVRADAETPSIARHKKTPLARSCAVSAFLQRQDSINDSAGIQFCQARAPRCTGHGAAPGRPATGGGGDAAPTSSPADRAATGVCGGWTLVARPISDHLAREWVWRPAWFAQHVPTVLFAAPRELAA